MGWYPETFVLPLLYPTPTRHCIFVLPLTSQLPAASKELKTSEPGLSYVSVEYPTLWWCPSAELPMGTGWARFLTCVALTCAHYSPILASSFSCSGWESQTMHFSIVTVPKDNAARFSSHSEIVTVWYGKMHLKSTASNYFSTNSLDMKQPGSKTQYFQELREGWTSAQGWKTGWWFHNSKARGQSCMPERQGMEYFQKQASPMDKIQCGLLILSTHVHKDVILNGIQADFFILHS